MTRALAQVPADDPGSGAQPAPPSGSTDPRNEPAPSAAQPARATLPATGTSSTLAAGAAAAVLSAAAVVRLRERGERTS